MANWYVEAKKIATNNTELNELLVKFELLPKGDERAELAEKIKSMLPTEAEVVAKTIEEIPEPTESVEIAEEFKNDVEKEINIYAPIDWKDTELDITKCQDRPTLEVLLGLCQHWIRKLESMRKKHETPKEAIELQHNIFSIQHISLEASKKLLSINMIEKRKKNMTEIPMIVQKRVAFVNLMKQGYSISNAILHPYMGGIQPKDLLEILDDDTIKKICDFKKGFGEHWEGWKKKFLPDFIK